MVDVSEEGNEGKSAASEWRRLQLFATGSTFILMAKVKNSEKVVAIPRAQYCHLLTLEGPSGDFTCPSYVCVSAPSWDLFFTHSLQQARKCFLTRARTRRNFLLQSKKRAG
jgi:hypothetical protein